MLRAARGAIRGDAVEIELLGEQWPKDLTVSAKAVGRDGTKSWDFKARKADSTRAEAGGPKVSSWRLKIALEDLPKPTYGIELVASGGAVSEVPVDPAGWHLGFLAPKDDKEFAARYTWIGQRIRDDETLLFSLFQCLRHCQLSNANLASAAVIFGYRSLEADDAGRVELAMRFVAESLPLVSSLGATRHVRSDRDHMVISLNTIGWHLALYANRRTEMMQSLANIHSALEDIEDAWSVGYNGSKGLLLYSVMLALEGSTERARQINNLLFILFQRAAASSQNTNPTLFNDFRMVHRATFLGMVMNRTFDGLSTPNDMRVTMELIAPDVLRVRNKRVTAKLTARLNAFELGVREADVAFPAA